MQTTRASLDMLIRRWDLTTCAAFLLALMITSSAFSQRPVYAIQVTLDTLQHELSGFANITYTNASTVPLESLALHLWANAYSNKNTTFAKQLLNLGALYFNNAKPEEMGGYEKLTFSSSDDSFEFHFDPEHNDIAWLVLSKPLLPGKSIHFTASFVLKIPISFSRIGRTGDSYQLTQWYPHIAVYDLEGWHTMPYLDQGEYFNDFADYDVKIELPSGYIIAATGMLADKQIHGEKALWQFHAENVIDFAWFANPHFQVMEKKVEMEKGINTLLSVYIDTLSPVSWANALTYAEQSLKFYSDWLGPYPYPHMSVVSAPWSRGGYMEYPMVAQIGTTEGEDYLDIVIAHEVGHTWLYGILASDERSNPWMDEGLNTFFERKYAQQYYPAYMEVAFPEILRNRHSMPDNDALQHTMTFTHQLQPPATDPYNQIGDQYLFSAYLLPAEGLEMMQSRLGEGKMKAMFRQYFHDRKFSHVAPVDLRVTFETNCNCDLSWFFDDWIREGDLVNYRIKKFKSKSRDVTIVNKGNADLPLEITSLKDNEVVNKYWLDGFRGEKTFHLDRQADEVRLFNEVPAVNESWWRNSTPKSFLPNISLFPNIGGYDGKNWSISPFVGYNISDGAMIGPVIISDLFPQRCFKWTLAPLYGLESHALRGYAEGRFAFDMHKGAFDKMLISMSVNRFGYDFDTHYNFRNSFLRLSPSIALRVGHNENHIHLTQWWKYRYIHMDQFYGQGMDYAEKIFTDTSRQYGIHELSWSIRSDFVLRPYVITAAAQAGEGFVRMNINYQQHFTGKDKKRGIWLHAFAGYQPVLDDPAPDTRFVLSGIPSIGNNTSDYTYDYWLGGRNAQSGILAHQVFMKDAGFKTLAYNDLSSNWMTAAGLSYALPFNMFHLYMDAALYNSDLTNKSMFNYSGGLAVVVVKDVIEIYLPLVESKNIRESIAYDEYDKWYKRICFQANINLMNPIDVVDRATLRY